MMRVKNFIDLEVDEGILRNGLAANRTHWRRRLLIVDLNPDEIVVEQWHLSGWTRLRLVQSRGCLRKC